MVNKTTPKKTIEKWKKQDRAAIRKLKAYKEEEASFMRKENNGSKQAKLKKL